MTSTPTLRNALVCGVTAALLGASLAGCGVTTPVTSPSPTAQPSRSAQATPPPSPAAQQDTRLALVTDFGTCDPGAQWAASTVRSWNVEAIITGGDNTQNESGGSCDPYTTSVWGLYDRGEDGRSSPPVWPTLGNHDYDDPGAGLAAYRAAFPYLPKDADPQQRWYTVRLGRVSLFVLDSEAMSDADMEQQRLWLKGALRASRATDPSVWNLVVLHRPPYTSGVHEPNTFMRPLPEGHWNYADWGADLVVSGHQHIFEDVVVGPLHYVTAGISAGRVLRECADKRVSGSKSCVTGPGVSSIVASDKTLTLDYHQASPAGGTTVAATVQITR